MHELHPNPADHLVDENRVDRIREAATNADLDGLVALSPANSFYLTGCYVGMYSRPVVGVVTAETSGFGGPAIEERTARRKAWTEKAIFYEDTDDPLDVLAELFPDRGRFGIDSRLARPEWKNGLDDRVDAKFVDATEIFDELRQVKTDWELAMMRRSSDLAGAGIQAFLESVREGRAEIALANKIQDAFYETYLAEHPTYDIGTANELGQYGFANALSGSHALEPHSLSSSNEVDDGDSVVGIALPALQGYICEEERTVLVGNVDNEIRTAMETLVDIRREAMDMVEAGQATDEIDRVTSDRLCDAGYEEEIIHRTGHGEGVTIHEHPTLNERVAGELASGMVISIEPGLYFRDRGVALRHSDTLVVKENGAERLTSTKADVIVVGD